MFYDFYIFLNFLCLSIFVASLPAVSQPDAIILQPFTDVNY